MRTPVRSVPILRIGTGPDSVPAPTYVQDAAKRYSAWPDKGPLAQGQRLTLLPSQRDYRVDRDVYIIHVHETVEPGLKVHAMGPKTVYGEYLDGELATASLVEGDPIGPRRYSGAVTQSPMIDFNFEVTVYRFADPGWHEFQWRLGMLRSNTLRVEIVADPHDPERTGC